MLILAGRDLGLVSPKVLCSLITVFLLMPGLMPLFSARCAERRTSPMCRISPPGTVPRENTLRLCRDCLLIILPHYLVLEPDGIRIPNDAGIDELKYSRRRGKITGTFANDTTIAVLVPSGN